MRRLLATIVMAMIAIALYACAPAPTATTPVTPSREVTLIAAAQKEGKVAYWASTAKSANKYLAKFKERYPWLELELWDASAIPIAEKVIAEAKAGRHSVDMIHIAEETMALLPTDLFAKYDWPNMADWPREALPRGGFYVLTHVNPMGPAYNSKIVPREKVPTSWEELKDPKWKGKTAAALDSEEVPLLLAAMWGSEGKLDWDRSFNFWREVFQNTQPRTVKGYTNPTQLLGAGEYELFLLNSGAVATRLKVSDGLPVDLIPVKRLPAKATALAILKDAPHPNAAKLLADYMTSAEGATIFADTMFSLSLNPKASGAAPNRILKEKGTEIYLVPSNLMTQENLKKSSEFWSKLFGLGK